MTLLPEVSARLSFNNIWGIGPKTADDLVRRGFRSISDIRERGLCYLTPAQRTGVTRYEDLLERIPRKEVEDIGNVIINEASTIFPGALLSCCICYG